MKGTLRVNVIGVVGNPIPTAELRPGDTLHITDAEGALCQAEYTVDGDGTPRLTIRFVRDDRAH